MGKQLHAPDPCPRLTPTLCTRPVTSFSRIKELSLCSSNSSDLAESTEMYRFSGVFGIFVRGFHASKFFPPFSEIPTPFS